MLVWPSSWQLVYDTQCYLHILSRTLENTHLTMNRYFLQVINKYVHYDNYTNATCASLALLF